MSTVLSPAGQVLDRALRSRSGWPCCPDCVCGYVNTGTGTQKAAEDPDCPACTLLGFASWALEHGMAGEKAAAQLYLREWEADMSAQAMTEARLLQDGARFREEAEGLDTAGFVQRTLDRIGTEGGYAERPGELTGRYVWLSCPARRVAAVGRETRWMAQAEAGAVTNGYVKTDRSFAGLPVWEKSS